MKTFAPMILGVLLFGCNTPSTPTEMPAVPSTAIKGHYIWGAEVNTFKPCGSDKTFWVEGNGPAVRELQAKYLALAKKPYEETFAVVSGKIRDRNENSDGFDADFDGLIAIGEIHSMAGSASSDCK